MRLTRAARYAGETAAAYLLYGFFRLLPLEAASALGGRALRLIGPRLGAARTARRNLAAAFPEKTEGEIAAILDGMWDNLGRVLGEYPHLRRIWRNVTLEGGEHLEAARDSGKASIFFAGHLANWELNAIGGKKKGLDITLVYRKPNNPWVDGLLRHARDSGAAGHIGKGPEGARALLGVIRARGAVGMLVDQKLGEGVSIPFFGRPAMTAPAIAHFALKYGCPLYPSRIERLSGAAFRMTVFPPLEIESTGDRDADTRAILTRINGLLESWVRERPEQWLWTHRRWDAPQDQSPQDQSKV